MDALSKLQVNPAEVVYVGDSPIEDIKGAKDVGLKTVFMPSQFNTKRDLLASNQEPDFMVKDLTEFLARYEEIIC
jgi:FMN phosphatase YigB (HAD superfamily)